MQKYLLFLFLTFFNSKLHLDANKVILAIDCGAEQSKFGSDAYKFEADQGFQPNTKVADYSLNDELKNADIKYTDDPFVYMTERHGEESFTYQIPIKENGNYVLILKFAEMYFDQAGKRVFNVLFGDKIVVENLDIFQKAGKFAAYDHYIDFSVSNGVLFHKSQPIFSALQNSSLKLHFQKIGLDNPKVDGIVLFKGTLAESDFDSIAERKRLYNIKQQQKQEELEMRRLKEQNARMKKKEKIKVRNDQYEEFEEEFEQFDEMEIQGEEFQKYGLIGGVLVVVLAGLYFMNKKSKND